MLWLTDAAMRRRAIFSRVRLAMLSRLLAVLAVVSGSPPHLASVAADCRHLPTPPGTAAMPNDNRTSAGTLRDGVLTLRLVARDAAWRPDGPSACALAVHAFAEEGGPVRVPGPLVRVRAGTPVHVTIRNALATPYDFPPARGTRRTCRLLRPPGDYSIRVQRFAYDNTAVAAPAPGGTVLPIRVRAP